MYLIIPTTLVHIFFCTAIPTSPINFIQLFFMLATVLFFFAALWEQVHMCACVCTVMLYIVVVVVCITHYKELHIDHHQLVIIIGGQHGMLRLT